MHFIGSNIRCCFVGLLLCVLVAPVCADDVLYGVFDGKKYNPDQLGPATGSPIQIEASRLDKGTYLVPRAADGHYYISGTVNGFPVVFLVDTGASYTVIPLQLAKNAGIRAGKQVVAATANGEAALWLSTANIVGLGPFTVKNSIVAVAQRLQSPLLGVDLLNKFQVTYANGYMILRVPS